MEYNAGSLPVFSPFDLSLIETIKLQTAQEAESTLSDAEKLFKIKSTRLLKCQRIEILEKTLSLLIERKDYFIQLAVREGGKPIIDTKVEVERAIQGLKIALAAMYQFHGTEIPMGLTASSMNRIAFTSREPIGVVLAISAFNHPLNLIIHQVVPAIAVGVPVIIKPALTTPLSCIAFIRLLYEAGLPQEWAQVLICEDPITEKLATDPRTKYVSFIGSAKVGWYLRSKLAPGTRIGLEHGGAAPVVITEDANLDLAVPALLKGGFYHAGQVCVSVQRIYAHETVFEELTERLNLGARKIVVGDPMQESTEVGPLILPREVKRVDDWVGEAINSGGRLICGGEILNETCYSPTIIVEPSTDCKLSSAEIFGPVIAVYKYRNEKEAIEKANALPYIFQAGVFSQSIDRAFEIAQQLKATTVLINDHSAFRVDWAPFGGQGESGLGVGGIQFTMNEYSYEKQTIIKQNPLAFV